MFNIYKQNVSPIKDLYFVEMYYENPNITIKEMKDLVIENVGQNKVYTEYLDFFKKLKLITDTYPFYNENINKDLVVIDENKNDINVLKHIKLEVYKVEDSKIRIIRDKNIAVIKEILGIYDRENNHDLNKLIIDYIAENNFIKYKENNVEKHKRKNLDLIIVNPSSGLDSEILKEFNFLEHHNPKSLIDHSVDFYYLELKK